MRGICALLCCVLFLLAFGCGKDEKRENIEHTPAETPKNTGKVEKTEQPPGKQETPPAKEETPDTDPGEKVVRIPEEPDIAKTPPGYLFPTIKAGFIYVNPPGDAGWTKAHDDARKKLTELPFVASAEYIENVGETKENGITAITELINRGCNLIFTTSFVYLDATYAMAERHPNIVFMHCSGYKTRKNLGTYFGRMYQARYLSGLIAGKMTQSNKVGYLIPYSISECIRGANAFAIGVREANPKARVYIRWSNTWYDPGKERELAAELIDEGIDVMAQHQDSPASVVLAQENGIFAIGYNSDMTHFAPEAHLTSPIWHWDKICNEVATRLHNGTWRSEQILWGLEKGVIGLAPLNERIPRAVQELVEQRRQQIIRDKFHVFQGPLKDQQGKQRLAPGKTFSDEELLKIDFFVDSIVGELPEVKAE